MMNREYKLEGEFFYEIVDEKTQKNFDMKNLLTNRRQTKLKMRKISAVTNRQTKIPI